MPSTAATERANENWDVQGISTKRIEVFRELERLNVVIAALTETKRKGNGIEEEKKTTSGYIVLRQTPYMERTREQNKEAPGP